MAVSHLKSTPITNIDTVPPVPNAPGEGGIGYLQTVNGYVTTVAADSTDTTYQFVRVPSNAKVKHVYFESAAQAAGTIDIGVYYATDGRSGPSKATSLLAANAIDQDFFASAIVVTSAVVITDVVNESTTNTTAKRTQPLWQALGLTSDPMCMFDIVGTVGATAITTGAATMGVEVQFTV